MGDRVIFCTIVAIFVVGVILMFTGAGIEKQTRHKGYAVDCAVVQTYDERSIEVLYYHKGTVYTNVSISDEDGKAPYAIGEISKCYIMGNETSYRRRPSQEKSDLHKTGGALIWAGLIMISVIPIGIVLLCLWLILVNYCSHFRTYRQRKEVVPTTETTESSP